MGHSFRKARGNRTSMRVTRRGRAVASTGIATLLTLLVLTIVHVTAGGSSEAVHLESEPTVQPLVTTPAKLPPPVTRPTASPKASPTHTKSPSPKATRTHATASSTRRTHGTGDLVVVPGSGSVVGDGPLKQFKVEVESGAGVNGPAFAAAVERILGQDKSWGSDYSFKRVSSGPVSFTVTLASPSKTDSLCRPYDTGGQLSCFNGSRSVINADRWKYGAPTYAGDLSDYRIYVVSHEV